MKPFSAKHFAHPKTDVVRSYPAAIGSATPQLWHRLPETSESSTNRPQRDGEMPGEASCRRSGARLTPSSLVAGALLSCRGDYESTATQSHPRAAAAAPEGGAAGLAAAAQGADRRRARRVGEEPRPRHQQRAAQGADRRPVLRVAAAVLGADRADRRGALRRRGGE